MNDLFVFAIIGSPDENEVHDVALERGRQIGLELQYVQEIERMNTGWVAVTASYRETEVFWFRTLSEGQEPMKQDGTDGWKNDLHWPIRASRIIGIGFQPILLSK